MKAKQQGFTLVELVVVIVVLGILAAIAIPRYANYTREARIASLNGLAGAVRSSVGLVQARYVAAGTGTSPVTLADGVTTVAVSTGAAGGIPLSAAGGIGNALNINGFAYTPGGASGTFNLVPTIGACNVTYTAATGAAVVDPTSC
jgi:MSHA pilin protein MshA